MQTNDGYVLKPVQSPPRGEREHNFFKRIFSSDDSDLNQDEINLRNFLPTYRGSLIHNESKTMRYNIFEIIIYIAFILLSCLH